MRRTLTAVALTALTAAAMTAASAEEAAQKQVRRFVVAHHGEGENALPDLATLEGDRLKIEDLATLLPGESRSYATESGREVLVTRGEGERYTLEVEGKTIEIGGEREELLAAHAGAGERRVIIRHQAKEGEAAAGETTVEEDVVMLAPHAGLTAGEDGGEPPVIIEIVDEAEGRKEHRFVVLRLGEPAEAP